MNYHIRVTGLSTYCPQLLTITGVSAWFAQWVGRNTSGRKVKGSIRGRLTFWVTKWATLMSDSLWFKQMHTKYKNYLRKLQPYRQVYCLRTDVRTDRQSDWRRVRPLSNQYDSSRSIRGSFPLHSFLWKYTKSLPDQFKTHTRCAPYKRETKFNYFLHAAYVRICPAVDVLLLNARIDACRWTNALVYIKVRRQKNETDRFG